MKKYWLCIEPSVFIWKDNDRILLYNSYNYEKMLQARHSSIDNLIDALIEPSNFFSVLFSDADTKCEEFKEFVEKIVGNRMGHILPFEKNDGKPITIPPHYVFPQEIKRLKEKKIELYDGNMLDNLQSVTMQITGECSLSCSSCDLFHKQINHCSKLKDELPLEAIKAIVFKLSLTNIRKINIIGGDIFRHTDFSKVIDVLDDIAPVKIFHSHFKFVNKCTTQLLLRDDSNILLKILVEPLDIWLEDICLLLDELHEFNNRLIWAFALTSEDSLKNFEHLVNRYKISNYEYHVLFNGHNMDFIIERCFLNEDEIWQSELGMKDVFANQILNKIFFGKLMIYANGLIYDDQNEPPIGTIHDNMEKMLYGLMWNEGAWLRIRRNVPCRGCVNRFLCPPPSRLESLLRRNTICNIITNTD
ncbi:MAG: TIGR04150 pseudo-rSAM protein [Bacteroidetes bacterium]|nr:TIGR04150 pseudo-rSAM protein [Bacteroidota bacterium]